MPSDTAERPAQDQPPSAAPPRGWFARIWSTHQHLVLGVILLALFLAARLAFLGADPPMSFPNLSRAYELFTDPPAKSYEARNWALFGKWSTSPADNYQFWRIQAPVWVYPLALYYKVFGVSYPKLRLFSTLCATSGMALYLVLARERLRGFAYFLAGSFLAFNYYYVIYGRSGLVEAWLNTFVILTVLCLHFARRNLLWLMGAEIALTAAFLTKQSGLYLLPVCLVAGALSMRAHRRRGGSRLLFWAPVGLGAALGGVMAWYVFRPAYWRTVSWNYGHMLFNENSTSQVEVHRFPLADALRRLVTPETWGQHYAALFPVAGVLALIGVGRLVYLAVRRREIEAWDVLVAGWLAMSFGVLLLTPLTAVHYRLILFPPAAMMGAQTVQVALDTSWAAARPRLVRAACAVVLVGDLSVHGFWWGKWVMGRTYDLIAAGEVLKSEIRDERATFCGAWAGPLVFETRSKYYYLKAYFNEDPESIAQLYITHVLEIDQNDFVSKRLWATHPDSMRSRRHLMSFDIRGKVIHLYWLRKLPRLQSLDRPAEPRAD